MAYRKLGRTSSQRKALLRDLTTDLIINERIVTTEARAKEIRSTVEKMITLGKRGDLHARRQAAAFVRNEVADVREEGESIVVETALQKLFLRRCGRIRCAPNRCRTRWRRSDR